jgi:deoxyribose-phosphate aldolase
MEFTQFLPVTEIARMLDISAVRADSSDQRITELVNVAQKFNCYLVTVLPSQVCRAKNLISENSSLKLGGNVGFPSGGQTRSIKIKETQELVQMDVDEIDMVIDIAAHISARYNDVGSEIEAVVDAALGRPVKVILECFYLSEDQIKIGCDLAIKAGASYIKTGTGWTPTGATLENVALIHRHVGDSIKIKASGGIRGAETLSELYRRGARRFGISLAAVSNLIASFEKQNNEIHQAKEATQ